MNKHVPIFWPYGVQHARLVAREAALKAQVAALEATVRDLHQRLDGPQSEQSSGADGTSSPKPATSRNRGQHPGRQGPGRSARSALPVVAAVHDVSEAATHCPACGEAFAPVPGPAESSLIDVQVPAQIRRIQRPRSQQTWQGPQVPGLVTAPPAPRVLPQSPLGVSVWTRVLLDKYL
jgi:transposase